MNEMLNQIIIPSELKVSTGGTLMVPPTCIDELGKQTMCPSMVWTSSDNTIAIVKFGQADPTVMQVAVIYGVKAGTATITASHTTELGIIITSNICTVTVIGDVPPVGGRIIIPPFIQVGVNNNIQIRAMCDDGIMNFGSADRCPPLTWTSSNTSVATVDNSGIATGISPGNTNITASYTSSTNVITSNICNLLVTITTPIGQLGSISIPSNLTLMIGLGFAPLMMIPRECSDTNGEKLSCPLLAWSSSNPSVATINSLGLIEAITAGTTTVVASANNIMSNQCTITVVNSSGGQLSTISIPTNKTIRVGHSKLMFAKCQDTSGLIFRCGPLSWTVSDPLIASIDACGIITGIAEGTANVTASSGTIVSNVCTIVVTSIIGCDDNGDDGTPKLPTNVKVGVNGQISLIATDNYGNMISNCLGMKWNSSDISVARVDQNGNITGISSGMATITAGIGNTPMATTTVVVSPILGTTTCGTGIWDGCAIGGIQNKWLIIGGGAIAAILLITKK